MSFRFLGGGHGVVRTLGSFRHRGHGEGHLEWACLHPDGDHHGNFLSGGQETVADTRTVTLNVTQTANLQGRQEVGVSWSGAHPTGDIVPDPNSSAGEDEEYPFVLLECRGTAVAAIR